MAIFHIHFLCKNEEKILPYFFRHYDTLNPARYFAYYNIFSTDNTLDILKSKSNVTIIEDANKKFDERYQVSMKNELWMPYSNETTCDWVILVDTDEFLYHPDLLGLIKKYDAEGVTWPQVKGYQMFTDDGFPTQNKQIYEIIKKGREYHPYDKNAIFRSNIKPNYSFGCHQSNPQGKVVSSQTCDIKLLHYKIFGPDYPQKRLAVNNTLSDFNLVAGLGVYNTRPGDPFNPQVEYDSIKVEAVDII